MHATKAALMLTLSILYCPLPLHAASGDTQETGGVIEDMRAEQNTFWTFPEWYIVYSAEEQAAFLGRHQPSRFPWLGAIGQYWTGYAQMFRATKDYPFSIGSHLALVTIGTSFTVEYAAKAFYERTVGLATELLSFGQPTEEDLYAQTVAAEYGAFLHHTPFYRFPYGEKLKGLWRETSLWGPGVIRKWERKCILSAEYALKGLHGWILRKATETTYSPAAEEITLQTAATPQTTLDREPRIRATVASGGHMQLTIPRYQPFTDIVTELAREGVQIMDVAGNQVILLTALGPRDMQFDLQGADLLFTQKILTDPAKQRLAIRVPVQSLHVVIPALEKQGVIVEHLYDY